MTPTSLTDRVDLATTEFDRARGNDGAGATDAMLRAFERAGIPELLRENEELRDRVADLEHAAAQNTAVLVGAHED